VRFASRARARFSFSIHDTSGGELLLKIWKLIWRAAPRPANHFCRDKGQYVCFLARSPQAA
jgi:hypothetical protein